MKTMVSILGWTLRASAAICVTWIVVGVFQGRIADIPTLLGSVAWHAAFALSGAQLVGCAKRMGERQAAAVEA